jgi:hypothetical protein
MGIWCLVNRDNIQYAMLWLPGMEPCKCAAAVEEQCCVSHGSTVPQLCQDGILHQTITIHRGDIFTVSLAFPGHYMIRYIYHTWDLAEWLERLAVNDVATFLGSIPASSDAMESEERQMKQCWITNIKRKYQEKNPPLSISTIRQKLQLCYCHNIIYQLANNNCRELKTPFIDNIDFFCQQRQL